ncbi:hypothetical protein M0802_002395 [Mischocyttarus mexicanus]|nr:hypothetical protein M0802_002395 [Mischocyttarus mexicanus]
MIKDGEKGKYKSPDGSKLWEYMAIFVCNLLNLCIGISVGWNAPTIVLLLSPNSPIYFTSSDISTLTAVMPAGNIFAAAVSIFILDRIGRKYTILLCTLPTIVSWSIIIMGKSVLMLTVARFLSGITLGLGLLSTTLYCGEISSIKTRGTSVSMLAIMFTIGVLLSYIIVPYLSMTKTASIFLFLSISFVVMFSFMPESPYYLAMRGRTEEAEEVLEKLRGKSDVSDELATVLEFLKEYNNKRSTIWNSLKDIIMIKGHRRALFIVLLLVIIMQCSGFNSMVMYGQLIFHETASTYSKYTLNIFIGIALLLSSILTILLVDKLGRKPIIFVSGITVGLCTLTMTIYFYAKDYLTMDVSPNILISFVAPISIVFFGNSGFAIALYIMISELFAIEVKVIGSCISGVINGLVSTIVTKLYIHIAITLNYGHAYPFFGFCFITWFVTVLLIKMVPETKGKSFTEIQRKLQS